MVSIVWIGALLVIGGLLVMARTAIFRGELSQPHAAASDLSGPTLEPDHRGLRFLGVKQNWPGIVMVMVGGLMLLIGGGLG